MLFTVFRHVGEGNLGQVFRMEGIQDRVIQIAVGLQGTDGAGSAAGTFFHQLGKDSRRVFHGFRRHALIGAHLLQRFVLGTAIQDCVDLKDGFCQFAGRRRDG